MYHVHLKITGYTWTHVAQAAMWCYHVATMCHAQNKHMGPGPQRRSLCTVLRSPHVNKKSREQFMERTHTRFIYATCTPSMAYVFMALVERAHIPGIEMTCQLTRPGTMDCIVYI
jgi:ribosomal protein S10